MSRTGLIANTSAMPRTTVGDGLMVTTSSTAPRLSTTASRMAARSRAAAAVPTTAQLHGPEGTCRRHDLLGDAVDFGESSSLAGVEGCLEGLELLLQAIRQGLQGRSAGLPSNAVIAGS